MRMQIREVGDKRISLFCHRIKYGFSPQFPASGGFIPQCILTAFMKEPLFSCSLLSTTVVFKLIGL